MACVTLPVCILIVLAFAEEPGNHIWRNVIKGFRDYLLEADNGAIAVSSGVFLRMTPAPLDGVELTVKFGDVETDMAPTLKELL